MAMPQNRLKQRYQEDTTPVTVSDLMEAVRGIRDSIKSLIDCKIKDIEGSITDRVNKAVKALDQFDRSKDNVVQSVKGSVQKDIDNLTSHYSKQLDSIEKIYDVYNKRLGNLEMDLGVQMGKVLEEKIGKTLGEELTKTVDDRLTKRMSDVENTYVKNIERLEESYNKRLSAIEDKYNQDVEFVRKLQEQNAEQLRMLVERLSIPAPQVVVNQPEIKNDVVVHVPRQATPKIEVRIPELQQPEVIVQIPQARLVKKHIEYNQFGQPCEIRETVVEE